MKKYMSFIIVLISLVVVKDSVSQDVYKLWEEGQKPYYKENTLKEYEAEAWGTMCLYNVVDPTLTVYHAKGNNTGKAVIVVPGGGYSLVAIHHEGYDVAEKLAKEGITAAVLKYRLPNPKSSDQPEMVPLTDARKALKLFRKLAGKYGFNKNKVGMMGFSAGSHLTTVAGLWKSNDAEERPDYTGLIYGVTDLSEVNLKWLEDSLYFRKMTKEERAQNQLLDLVSKDTPPAFLVHAYDDKTCKVEESTWYAKKLYAHQVPVEIHLFPKGGHGFGLGRSEDGTDQWLPLFINWLKTNDL
jgi:acetyl esterase/lipase